MTHQANPKSGAEFTTNWRENARRLERDGLYRSAD
ncbi:uncharacterized protein METZ01_LOCUS239945, partial [marine metagenome]